MEEDVIYVRNASPHVISRDPRTPALVPAHVVSPVGSSGTVYTRQRLSPGNAGVNPQAAYYAQMSPQVASYALPPALASYAFPPQLSGYPMITYGTPGQLGNLPNLVNGFGGLGQLVDIAAQVLAAVMPLPAAPEPQGNGDNDTIALDSWKNSKNLLLYQTALATYAKRDEQIRTVGNLIKRLVG